MTGTQTKPKVYWEPRRMTAEEWSKRTLEDELADMRAHTEKLSKSREASLDFLQRAGILDENGQYTEPYRALAGR